MNASFRVPLQITADWRADAERFEQLELGIVQFDKCNRYAVVGLRHWVGYFRSQAIAIDLRGLANIGNSNRDVVKSSQHRFPPKLPWRRPVRVFPQSWSAPQA